MGYPNYNELANCGSIIYTTPRSTGQIEEGPVGCSLSSPDKGIVSWQPKPLNSSFSTLITAPQLITDVHYWLGRAPRLFPHLDAPDA